jgi:hypothetical protein
VNEPLSPELALVDPELAARARAALPERPPLLRPRAPRPVAVDVEPAPGPTESTSRSYPFWARMTAALWLLVLGILVGGTAIPHAQDQPRVVPQEEDATEICVRPEAQTPTLPPGGPFGQP